MQSAKEKIIGKKKIMENEEPGLIQKKSPSTKNLDFLQCIPNVDRFSGARRGYRLT